MRIRTLVSYPRPVSLIGAIKVTLYPEGILPGIKLDYLREVSGKWQVTMGDIKQVGIELTDSILMTAVDNGATVTVHYTDGRTTEHKVVYKYGPEEIFRLA